MEAAAIEIGVAVAGEEATSLLATVKKHVGYLYHYKDNLNALQEADDQLVAKMSDESKFSGETSRSVRDVTATIVNWRSNAKVLHQKAEKLTPRNSISRLKPWSRYSTSKNASELTAKIKEKVESGLDFGTSFDRPISEGAKFNLRGYMEFESRRRIQNEVLEALRRDDVTMCSICGMGGIGKTTLAKNLVKEVEANGFFEKVAMVTVSQSPNFEGIQKGIIDSLGLKIDGCANKLNDWLTNHRTLLILDDVWWQIQDDDFEKVGIPLASKWCKIVFTSRHLDECKKMGCEQNFALGVLDDGEAWELFIQSTGKCVEERNLQGKARQIVDECKGLPIAIVTIAGALKDKPLGAWNDSLKKLRMSNLLGISDMDKVHSKIKVSYDLLNDLEAQSCLRLCCLFPEDYNVPIEKLVFYGWGLEIFEGLDRLKEARDRVDLIVHKLKSSFLLLDGNEDGYVKLHDIVRDFAIWISSKDEKPYLVRCENETGNWPKNLQYEKSGAISFVHKRIKNHPVGLRCPNLKLLQLHLMFDSDELPNSFLDGMEELRVVDVDLSSKLPPLTVQKALKTLLISYHSDQMVSLGEGYMKNLEILVSSSRMGLSDFPKEIGVMCNLRCLRLHYESLTHIPPGVLSKLFLLEELELPSTFNDWGIQKEGRTNASLDEIALLPLTSISIGLGKGSILAENIVKSITGFQIFIGNITKSYSFHSNSNVLVVRKVDACDALVKWTSCLLRKCHNLELDGVDLKYIMSQKVGGNNCYQIECFSQLTTLKIKDMDCMEEILNGTYSTNKQQPYFTNLTTIDVRYCPKLKRAFPISVARELTQLQSMTLEVCGDMEVVFYDDQEDGGNQNVEERIEKVGEREVDHAVVLPRLKLLYLNEIPELRAMHDGNHAIECPSLENLTIIRCKYMKFLYYVHGHLSLKNMIGQFKNISKWLSIAQENGIQPIKWLEIQSCYEMKYLADSVEGPTFLRTFFSSLEKLTVNYMHSLEEIWHGPCLSRIHKQCFINLIELSIYESPKMKHLFPLAVARELRQLQVMKIVSCEEMEEIFGKDQVDDGNQMTAETSTTTTLVNLNKVEKSTALCPTPTSFIQCLLPKGKQPKQLPSHQSKEENPQEVDTAIVFPQLKVLSLSCMPKLRVMYNGNHTIECPSLEEMTISCCNNMEGLSYGSFSAPKFKRLSLQVDNIPKWLHLKQDSAILLKELRMEFCDEITYLVDAMTDRNLLKTLFCKLERWRIVGMKSLEEIWHVPYSSIVQPQPCFTHLTDIRISDCPKLKHVFPLSVAKELTQLQHLEIQRCEEMKEIFYKDQVADGNQNASSVELNSPTTVTESTPPYSFVPSNQSTEENTQKFDPAIVFPQLKELFLGHMNELIVMYDGNHTIECPLLEELTVRDCNNMEGLSYGSFSAPKLKKLKLKDMNNIPKWPHLKQDSETLLEELWIYDCDEMTYLADAMTDRNLLKTLLCNTKHLKIYIMDSLEEIWHGPYLSIAPAKPCFSHLTNIKIRGCPKLKHVFLYQWLWN